MNKHLTLLTSLILVSTFLFANTYTVDTTFDVSADDGLMTLREAIDSANTHAGPDTILFEASINGDTIKLTQGELAISDTLTMIGNGMDSTIIDGQGLDRVLSVVLSALYLNNLTIQNGGHRENGAGIYASAATLNVNHCRIHRNHAYVPGRTSIGVYGSGIYGSACSINIHESIIEKNQAEAVSGDCYGGGIYITVLSSLNISNSTIRDNEVVAANDGYGGGISANQSTLTMTTSTVNGNSAMGGNSFSTDGGGIYLDQGGSHYIKSSTISGNQCVGNNAEGGGINISSTTLDLISSTLTLNAVSGINSLYGGAVAGSATINLINTVIWGNFQNDASEVNGFGTVNHSLVRGYDLTGSDPNSFDGSEEHNPLFGPLAYNGGPTQTHALCYGSALYNTGNPDSLHFDQRGLPVFDTIDIGAFEAQSNLDTISRKKIFVDSSNTGGPQDGISWASAFPDLQSALEIACEKDTICVAEGTYYPSKDRSGNENERLNTFFIDKNIVMYGGFEGGNVPDPQRDWELYPTILSGDIGALGNHSDNSYHVIWMEYLDSCMILDGFTIKDGRATFSNSNQDHRNNGGGLYNNGLGGNSTPTISNNIFTTNISAVSGGAVYNQGKTNGNASPLFKNVMFVKNSTNGGLSPAGGAMYNNGNEGKSNPTFVKCTFLGNHSGNQGGALYNEGHDGQSNPTFTNCILSGNKADDVGGAMYNNALAGGESNPTFTNCSISGNASGSPGGVMYNFGPGGQIILTFNNTVIWGNSSPIFAGFNFTTHYNSSHIQGVDSGDPVFVQMPDSNSAPTIAGNLRLRPCSPLINAGDTSLIPDGVLYDLDGGMRVQRDTVDIGAYETPYVNGQNGIFYVDSSNASGTENGYSWPTAFTDLQDAIDAACEKDTIWVADGTYFPTDSLGSNPVNPRAASFYIDKNIVILGGFNGDETSAGERDWVANQTVLSGDIGEKGNRTDNAYHVVWVQFRDSCMLLSGFTIKDGNADNSLFPSDNGGGLFNHGSNGASTPTLTYCIFKGNSALNFGGGIYNDGYQGISSPTLINCSFSGNNAISGGGMYNNGDEGTSNPTLINCSFSGNNANLGGGMYNDAAISGESTPFLLNTIVFGNSNGLYNLAGATPVYSNSLVQGQPSDTSGNIPGTTDPLFVNMPEYTQAPSCQGNLRLRPCSPVINAGQNNSIPAGIIYDLDGAIRIQHSTVDMGSYESPFDGMGNVVIYVDSSNTDTLNNGGSWATAFADLQDALCLGCEKDTIWVAQGTYYPTDSLNKFVPSDPRKASFYIDSNLVILGGFEGNETSADDRDWEWHPTVLSGDIGVKGDSTDNAYHVVWTQNLDSCAVFDGFTVQDGLANNNSDPDRRGGGWYNNGSGLGNRSNPTLRNINIHHNTSLFEAGGMYNNGQMSGEASPTLIECSISFNSSLGPGGGVSNEARLNGIANPLFEKCVIRANYSGNKGGGIRNSGELTGECNPTFINCKVQGNLSDNDGGGVFNYGRYSGAALPTFINCIFSGNSSGNRGGGMFNDAISGGTCHPVVINCSFSGNSAFNSGGGMFNWGNSNPVISNTLISGNSDGVANNSGAKPKYKYSLVEGVIQDTSGNISGDIPAEFVHPPLYQNAPTSSGNLRLNTCSQAIDAGSNALIPPGVSTDLDGYARIVGDSVDMGAYEFDDAPPFLNCMDITVTLFKGIHILTPMDSFFLTAWSSPCFDSVAFSQEKFDCNDLLNSPIEIDVFGKTSNGYADQCSANVTVLPDPDYCCSIGENSLFNHIESVRLESSEDTLENISNDDNGYGGYAHLVTTVNAGAKLDIDLTAFTINPIAYKYWHIWIDYNDNGEYSMNELVYQAEGSHEMRSTSITIPTGISGFRTMRITMQLNPGYPEPCDGFPLGEVEDYGLYIESCPDVLILEDQSLGGVYFAGKEIRTKGEVIVTGDTKFMSQEFFLGKEFEVKDGVRFETVKSPCNVWLPLPASID